MMFSSDSRTTFSDVAMLVAACLGLSCSDGTQQPAPPRHVEGGAGEVGSTDDPPPAGADGAPKLTESHPGWHVPLCLSCHGGIAPLPHLEEGYQPWDCVGCHGYNGAAHRDHAVVENPGCTECHSTVSHVSSFTAPADCVRCHYHPDDPTGE